MVFFKKISMNKTYPDPKFHDQDVGFKTVSYPLFFLKFLYFPEVLFIPCLGYFYRFLRVFLEGRGIFLRYSI